LQISKSSQTAVERGATLVYTVTFMNSGTGLATGVVITETVPNNTSFDQADSSPGWSCPNGSPHGTTCTYSVGTLEPGAQSSLLFAVIVASRPSSPLITNSVQIADAEGGSSGAGSRVYIPARAPTLDGWGLSAALALIAYIARRHLRLRPER
jgi:uncharacterized repeat protein (TIGR01451 family)